MDGEKVCVGFIGMGDNFIRKVYPSIEGLEDKGIKVTKLAGRSKNMQASYDKLVGKTNDDGTLMYPEGSELRITLDRVKELVDSGEMEYECTRDEDFEEKFYDESIDAVHVSTSNETHAQYAIEASRHEKHIFVEKPFCESYESGNNTLEEMVRGNPNGKPLAKICSTHYLRYGPFQEILEHWEEIRKDMDSQDYSVKKITARFVEDKSYLNDRTKDQFSGIGAIHDMLVHYIGILNKLGADPIPIQTNTYTPDDYNNELAVISSLGLYGDGFDGEAELRAAKGAPYNSKNFEIIFSNGRRIKLNFLGNERGITDTYITGNMDPWWDDDQMIVSPYTTGYEELRDEVKRLDSGIDNGRRPTHTLEEAVNDLLILDQMKESSTSVSYGQIYDFLYES